MALTEFYVSTTGGGAHDGTSEANAFTWAEMRTNINAGGAAGKRYNVKNDSTYSRTTSSDNLTVAGTATSPIVIRGYNTVITDGYQGRSNSGAGDLVTTNMPTISYTTGAFQPNSFTIIEALVFTGAPTATAVISGTGGSSIAIVRSRIVNTASTVNALCCSPTGSNELIYDCDLYQTGASGAAPCIRGIPSGRIIACRLKSTSGPAIVVNVNGSVMVIALNSIFNNGVGGIAIQNTVGGSTILMNTFYGNTGDAIDIPTGSNLVAIIGNMLTDTTGWAGDFNNVANPIFIANNRTRDNSSGTYNLGTDWVSATSYGEVTTDTGGAATDYTDAPGGDLRLIALSPATSASLPLSASMGCYQRPQGSSVAFGPLSGTIITPTQ